METLLIVSVAFALFIVCPRMAGSSKYYLSLMIGGGTSYTRRPLSQMPAIALKRFKTENEIK